MDLVPPDLSDLTRRHFLEFTEAPGVLGIWGVWGEVRAGAYGVDTFRIMEPLGIFRFFFMWFFQVIYIDLLITKTLKHWFFLVFSYVYIEDCCHLPKPPTSNGINGQEAQPSYPWRIWRGTLWTVPHWDLPSWRWGWDGDGLGILRVFILGWDLTGAKNGDVYWPTSAKVMVVGIEWPDRLLFLVGGTRILFRRDFWKSSRVPIKKNN